MGHDASGAPALARHLHRGSQRHAHLVALAVGAPRLRQHGILSVSNHEFERLEDEMRAERRRDYREAMAEFFTSERGAEILDKVVAKIAEKQMARVGRWTIAN